MKIRVIKTPSGKFVPQYKKSFFSSWEALFYESYGCGYDICAVSFDTIEEAWSAFNKNQKVYDPMKPKKIA